MKLMKNYYYFVTEYIHSFVLLREIFSWFSLSKMRVFFTNIFISIKSYKFKIFTSAKYFFLIKNYVMVSIFLSWNAFFLVKWSSTFFFFSLFSVFPFAAEGNSIGDEENVAAAAKCAICQPRTGGTKAGGEEEEVEEGGGGKGGGEAA
jgi:hypothetical protein